MPWKHCDNQIPDNLACPKCEMTKDKWTTEWNVTRTIRIGKKKKKPPSLKILLTNHRDWPMANERYQVILPNGEIKEGTLDQYGYAKVPLAEDEMVMVSFPDRDTLDFMTGGVLGELASFSCDILKKNTFQLLPRVVEAKWNTELTYVGERVLACIKTKNVSEGTAAAVVIRERSTGREVDELNGPIREDYLEVPWYGRYDDPHPPDLTGEAYRELYLPPEYDFEVRPLCCDPKWSENVMKTQDFIELLARDEPGPLDYTIVLPDGEEKTGSLDERGWARVEAFPPGRVEVTLTPQETEEEGGAAPAQEPAAKQEPAEEEPAEEEAKQEPAKEEAKEEAAKEEPAKVPQKEPGAEAREGTDPTPPADEEDDSSWDDALGGDEEKKEDAKEEEEEEEKEEEEEEEEEEPEPSVTVEGPTTLSEGETKTYEAKGAPEGGTYSWTLGRGLSTTSSTTGTKVEVTGDAEGDAKVTVSYTVEGKKAEAEVDVKVQALKFDRLRWHMPMPESGPMVGLRPVWSNKIRDQIYGVAFRKDVKVQVQLHKTSNKAVELESKLPIQFWPDIKAQSRCGDPIECTVVEDEGEYVTVDVPHETLKQALQAHKSPVSMCWYRAGIAKEWSSTGKDLKTPNLVYPVLQHALYFLPGVLGSELSVKSPGGGVEECFPEVSVHGNQELDLLVCKEDGNPWRQIIRSRLKILDYVLFKFEALTKETIVYQVKEKVEPLYEAFPTIYLDSAKTRRLDHFQHEDIPYDWRLNIEKSHKDIAKEILEKYKKLLDDADNYPFLAKAALAGHSTGGVVMRGLMTTDNVLKDHLGDCFFINVPQLGAPKAEYVYLTGDMGVAVVTNMDSFRQIAPDMPIVYFLCSGAEYTKRRADPNDPDFGIPARKARLKDAIDRSVYDEDKRELYGRPEYQHEGPLEFNDAIGQAAEAYFAQTVRDGPKHNAERAFTFHSGGHPTIRATRIVGDKVFPDLALNGDGTVPTISQLGDIADWKESTLFKPLPKNPMHVPSPNSEWLWDKVLRVLTHQDIDEFTMDWPKTPKEKTDFILAQAVETQKKKGGKSAKETASLAANASRSFEHPGMLCGMAQVECTSGEIEVFVQSGGNGRAHALVAGDKRMFYLPGPLDRETKENQKVAIRGRGAAGGAYSIDFISAPYLK